MRAIPGYERARKVAVLLPKTMHLGGSGRQAVPRDHTKARRAVLGTGRKRQAVPRDHTKARRAVLETCRKRQAVPRDHTKARRAVHPVAG